MEIIDCTYRWTIDLQVQAEKYEYSPLITSNPSHETQHNLTDHSFKTIVDFIAKHNNKPEHDEQVVLPTISWISL